MTTTNLPVEANENGNAPVAPKVLAGTLGAGIGGAMGSAIVWAIGIFCPGGSFDASTVDKTIAACPSPIAQLVPIVVAGLGALVLGYRAPHQQRLEDVTAALAKYVVGSNETEPAPHDAAPDDPAESTPVEDEEAPDVPPDDRPADVPAPEVPAQPAAPAAPAQ